MDAREEKKIHEAIDLLGLRAHATAVGFIQLTIELNKAGVLGADAVDRIKHSIVRDLGLSKPSSVSRDEFDRNNRERLDRLFGGEPVGPKTTLGTSA